jgi:hypothetical protein
MKLWFDKHSRFYNALANFEEDEIEDFAGHDYFEDLEDDDEEEEDATSWLHPPKGPGKFKKKNKKKQSKKTKKNKKKSKKDEL